jgi:hypothetical protein
MKGHAMKGHSKIRGGASVRPALTELMLLPNGQILIHNLTPAFAALLRQLNFADKQMAARTRPPQSANHRIHPKHGTRNPKPGIRITSHGTAATHRGSRGTTPAAPLTP